MSSGAMWLLVSTAVDHFLATFVWNKHRWSSCPECVSSTLQVVSL